MRLNNPVYIGIPPNGIPQKFYLTEDNQPDEEAGDLYIQGDRNTPEIYCVECLDDLLFVLEKCSNPGILPLLEEDCKELLAAYFIYSLDSDNYLRKKPPGLTEAETIRLDFDCPHDTDDPCTCMQECEDAVVYGYESGKITVKSLVDFIHDYGKLTIEY